MTRTFKLCHPKSVAADSGMTDSWIPACAKQKAGSKPAFFMRPVEFLFRDSAVIRAASFYLKLIVNVLIADLLRDLLGFGFVGVAGDSSCEFQTAIIGYAGRDLRAGRHLAIKLLLHLRRS